MTQTACANPRRLAGDAGIAIGPILFIIAVLGILASAIAAGSGSFTTNTTNESNRTKATALIDIGQNIKIGFDRIIGGGIEFADVIIDPEETDTAEDLFSPSGGGVSAPSYTMSEDPDIDRWFYPMVAIPRIGTSNGSRVAVLKVSEGVCDEINLKANALAAGTAASNKEDMGDFTDTTNVLDGLNWAAPLYGKPTGCVQNENGASSGFYFYQVLGVQ